MLLAGLTALVSLAGTANALKYNETLDPYNVNKNRGEHAPHGKCCRGQY